MKMNLEEILNKTNKERFICGPIRESFSPIMQGYDDYFTCFSKSLIILYGAKYDDSKMEAIGITYRIIPHNEYHADKIFFKGDRFYEELNNVRFDNSTISIFQS